jgi:hypothetical protein
MTAAIPTHLTLRSGPEGRVSKGGNPHLVRCLSFETAASRPPQDEVFVGCEFP